MGKKQASRGTDLDSSTLILAALALIVFLLVVALFSRGFFHAGKKTTSFMEASAGRAEEEGEASACDKWCANALLRAPTLPQPEGCNCN